MTTQTRSATKLILGAALAGATVLTAGCAGRDNGPRDTAYVARDVESLYWEAKRRLDNGQAEMAAALFDEVERQHPYSPWARRAQLMGSFSYYVAKDYNKAIAASQRFLQIHPGNKDAPYAFYLIALSYYEQISDVQRDQKITDQALTALNEINRRFPNSDYAADARLKIDLVRDHLVGKEMEIGRHYERSGKWIAARSLPERGRQLRDHQPRARGAVPADRDQLALGIPAEAVKYAAVLGANYPGSEWYDKAYDLAEARPGRQRGLILNRCRRTRPLREPRPSTAVSRDRAPGFGPRSWRDRARGRPGRKALSSPRLPSPAPRRRRCWR